MLASGVRVHEQVATSFKSNSAQCTSGSVVVDLDATAVAVRRPANSTSLDAASEHAAPVASIACGPRVGQKVLTLQGATPRQTDSKQTLCADIDGFSLHAAVLCAADDRHALEQLKEGALAGPRALKLIVDTVLYFEGDTHRSFRLVRAIKNRFGAVNEIGVFAMTERGLKGASNPIAIFLSMHGEPVLGTCVLVMPEGTRPLMVEIQVLVDSGELSPWRLSVGLDRDRLAMLLAVLHRHDGVACLNQDVFVNGVGGVRIGEPAADLAVLLAIQGSLRGKALRRGFLALGEVGLAGEVRPASRDQERLKESAKLGFSVAVVLKANAPKKPIEGLTVHAVERIEQAIDVVRGLGRARAIHLRMCGGASIERRPDPGQPGQDWWAQARYC